MYLRLVYSFHCFDVCIKWGLTRPLAKEAASLVNMMAHSPIWSPSGLASPTGIYMVSKVSLRSLPCFCCSLLFPHRRNLFASPAAYDPSATTTTYYLLLTIEVIFYCSGSQPVGCYTRGGYQGTLFHGGRLGPPGKKMFPLWFLTVATKVISWLGFIITCIKGLQH